MDGVPDAPCQSFRESVGPAALYRCPPLIAVTYSFGGHMSTLCERPRYAVFSQRLGLIADRLASPSIFLILLKHGLASVFNEFGLQHSQVSRSCFGTQYTAAFTFRRC